MRNRIILCVKQFGKNLKGERGLMEDGRKRMKDVKLEKED
jgi:hypothetical protein